MDQRSFNKLYPEAHDALPVPYQNDDVLFFECKKDETLYAFPKPSQVEVLGDWRSKYDAQKGEWIDA